MIHRDDAIILAERFGTPLYVYDLDEIDTRCAELRSFLPSGAQLFYSLKANPAPAIAAAARAAGTRAEVSSEGELEVALQAGFDAAGMLFTGPGKGAGELALAMRHGVGCFSAESWRDLRQIDEIARAASLTARAILRVNCAAAPGARLAMMGVPSQFGFDEAELTDLGGRTAKLANVEVVGIHAYFGTQIPDAATLAKTFRVGLESAVGRTDEFAVRIVDLGGGFPWPFVSDAAPADLSDLGPSFSELDDLLERVPDAQLWFESGRYVAGSCGTLLVRVEDVKQSRGQTYVVLDTGISHLGGMSGLGRLMRPTASFVAVDPERGGEECLVDVVGPLCTPLDCLARGLSMALPQPGDLLAVPNAGAYGPTASLTGFLSRPAALEVSRRGGAVVDVARLRSGHEAVPFDSEVSHDGAAVS